MSLMAPISGKFGETRDFQQSTSFRRPTVKPLSSSNSHGDLNAVMESDAERRSVVGQTDLRYSHLPPLATTIRVVSTPSIYIPPTPRVLVDLTEMSQKNRIQEPN